jgi:hypothetical protein
MRLREGLEKPRQYMKDIVYSLERYGKFHEPKAAVRVERWTLTSALDRYQSTLKNMRATIEGEPPSATMVKNVTVDWALEKAEFGFNVRQTHRGEVHPEVKPLIQDWMSVGAPYPSSGGYYYTMPNKSYEKVVALAKYPDLRDSVINLGLEDQWLDLWERWLLLRTEVSRNLLQLMVSGRDPEALSRGNPKAGTGLQIRGMRAKREDLVNFGSDLEPLIDYAFAMSAAFAATQIAKLPPGYVFVIHSYHHQVKGAIAARSDFDIKDVSFDGDFLTMAGVAQTRQAGTDGSGVFANAATEKQILGGQSCTEKFLREVKHHRVEYPFTNKELLIRTWAADAKPFKGMPYVVGEDVGLTEPVSSPADALFSRTFVLVGGKMINEMMSGKPYTQVVYVIFQNYFADKLEPSEMACCLGDDINTLFIADSRPIEERIRNTFHPYEKVKTTDPVKNQKKILGLITAMSQKYDPHGHEEALMCVGPRNLRSVSSATKRGGHWQERLSDLPSQGQMVLEQPPETLETVKRDLEIIMPYLHWKGPRAELHKHLNALWSRVPTKAWTKLLEWNPDLQYRVNPDEALDPGQDD